MTASRIPSQAPPATVSPTAGRSVGALERPAGAGSALGGSVPSGPVRDQFYLVPRGGDGASLDPTALQSLAGGPERPQVSPLMSRIADAVSPVAHAGTVPPGLLLSLDNRVDPTPLLGGPAIYRAVRESIASAQEEVLFQNYDWEIPSEAVSEVLAGLIDLQSRRAQEGAQGEPVRVRIVVDECNSIYDRLRSFNLRSHQLLQDAIAELKLDPSLVDVKTASHHHYGVGALHSKTLVVDSSRVLLTSANPQAYERLEAGFQVQGSIADGLREDFRNLWILTPAGKMEPLESIPYAPSAPPLANTVPGVPILLASRKADGSLLSNDVQHPLGQSYLAGLRNAEEQIRVLMPNLNDDDIVAELKAALKRGVRLELVLCHTFNDLFQNLPLQGGSNKRTVSKLIQFVRDEGLPPELLDVRWFRSENGGDVKDCWSHVKYVSIDGQLAIIGSSNLDTQSINHSREVNAVFDSRAVTREWDEKLFEPVFDRSLRETVGGRR